MEALIQEWQWHHIPQSRITIPLKLNTFRKINRLLENINEKIPPGTFITGWAETQEGRKKMIMKKFRYPLNKIIYAIDFLIHRILPKFNKITSSAYFLITGGKNRVLSKAEILGRICSCGFTIENYNEEGNILRFTAKKKFTPVFNQKASWWPIFRMQRVGRNGKLITIYKLRTMHPYSEYLQQYILEKHGLDSDGKFSKDYRVSSWGQFLRKYWIDELPMIINVLKGDLKIVGVRPISAQYFQMYPSELRALRSAVKPGLFPPFYADCPGSFEEIVKSEIRYLESYNKNPLVTDVRYLLLGLYNIIFKKIRSK